MLDTHLRQAATLLLEIAIRIAPPDAREWGQAMRGELHHVEGAWGALVWALGSASVLAKAALVSLFVPGRRRQAMVPDGGLFAKNVSLSNAALVAGGACVLGALLFFAAPPFRHGVRVSLAAWHDAIRPHWRRGQPELEALAKRAEANHDAEGLAFVATKLWNALESARLAEEAVRLDPGLTWVYAVVAVCHPELPQLSPWVSELERWDPQNALFHLIAASSIASTRWGAAHKVSLKEAPKGLREDPAWQANMAAAFASSRFDDYASRLRELDRKVVLRYRFDDPWALLSGNDWGIPVDAFRGSQEFAQSIFQEGQKLEGHGDPKGAVEKYWAVARFGQMMERQAHGDLAQLTSTTLQAMAYRQLQVISEKEGDPNAAELFGYLAEKFDIHRMLRTRIVVAARWGVDISRRNGAVLQFSSLLMLIFAGLIVMAGPLLFVGSSPDARPGIRRVKQTATMVAFLCAVGLLLSSATVYLTYRPYWYILQNSFLTGDSSQTRDFLNFLAGMNDGQGNLLLNLPVYFWTGITLLSVTGLVLILLRHLLGRPRASPTS